MSQYTVPRCSTPGCTGHLGRFSDCLSEAVYDVSIDSADYTTGDSDWTYHVAYVDTREWPLHDRAVDSGGVELIIPKGTFLVYAYGSGVVTVEHCPTGDEPGCRAMLQAFSDIDAEWNAADDGFDI